MNDLFSGWHCLSSVGTCPSLIVPETEMCQEDRDAVRNVLPLVSNKDIYAGKTEPAEQELEEF